MTKPPLPFTSAFYKKLC